MNGRGFYVSYGFGDPQDARRAQRNSRESQEARTREEFMRQQQIRQRQQRQIREAEQKRESSGGLGYFLAALVGVAAGFIAKAFLGDPEEE